VARLGDAQVELADPSGQVLLASAGPLRLSYDDPADTTILFDVQYGQGSFWAGNEDRLYRGAIELDPRAEGLTVVNLLSVEEYLYSVLPSEMPSHWPQACLQAQAVAARSYTLANLGRFAARGFDLLGSVASAAYRGAGAETPAVREAVDATHGLVLMAEGKPLSAFYSANCGGHTDTTLVAWGFPSALPAVPDPLQEPRPAPLDPEGLARWLSGRPAAYCSHPSYSGRSAYRWQLWVPRREIERRLEDPGLGSILAIVPGGRGLSGRAAEARIRGTTGELTVRRDALRWALGGLRSNLFVVEPKLGRDGLPEYFLFTGGGWGHGVGLCQSGAAAMAAVGYSAGEILARYYGAAPLQRQY
jgi:peptidoglycan hydrolase-like amidase